MSRCSLVLSLCLAFVLQASAHRIRIGEAKEVLGNTSVQKVRGSPHGFVDFWLLGNDWAGEGWQAGPSRTLGPLAVSFNSHDAWRWVNTGDSAWNVYWALHCFRRYDGKEEAFGFSDNGSLRSSPLRLGQRTYTQFWEDVEPNIKKWFDEGYSEERAKIHDQVVSEMASDMSQATIHDQVQLMSD